MSRKPAISSRSTHLDAFRALAALEVFAGHMRQFFLADYPRVLAKGFGVRLLFFCTSFGRSAVMVFFVLSGYLISRSVIERVGSGRWSWTAYLVQRGTRLYAVLLPALVLGAIWDAASSSHLPTTMSAVADQLHARSGLGTWIGNLLFLQGIAVETYGSNGPLWSLSYELWYYLAFPYLVLAVRGGRLVTRAGFALAASAILILVGGEIARYFLIWLLGVVVGSLPVPSRSRAWTVSALGAGLMLLLLVRSTLRGGDGFVLDLAIGAAFAAIVWGTLGLQVPRAGLYTRLASAMAGFSYTLYLVHYPIIVFLSGVVFRDPRWQPTAAATAKTGLIGALVLGYARLVWLLAESRTDRLRAIVMAFLERA